MSGPVTWNDPAFPTEQWGNQEIHQHGLTKRELIAAMAMQGMLACFRDFKEVGHASREESPRIRARIACEHADALLAELAKEKSTYPPCKCCSGPNDIAEICSKCAKGNDPFFQADNCGKDLK